jgi:hypothetical protein
MDKFRVAKYPGRGEHTILFDFFGRNQAESEAEDIHYNTTYRISNGDSAGINGYPIFVNLTVGKDGVAFRCRTVNVTSSMDQGLAAVFDSGIFRQGLQLTTQAQPALRPFVEMANGVVKAMLYRSCNKRVQDFSLGLDFSRSPASAKLREGAYVVVQAPDDKWLWSDWVFDTRSSRIIRKDSGEDTLAPAFNYLIFSVTRMG